VSQPRHRGSTRRVALSLLQRYSAYSSLLQYSVVCSGQLQHFAGDLHRYRAFGVESVDDSAPHSQFPPLPVRELVGQNRLPILLRWIPPTGKFQKALSILRRKYHFDRANRRRHHWTGPCYRLFVLDRSLHRCRKFQPVTELVQSGLVDSILYVRLRWYSCPQIERM
jgi:hypothetical protein